MFYGFIQRARGKNKTSFQRVPRRRMLEAVYFAYTGFGFGFVCVCLSTFSTKLLLTTLDSGSLRYVTELNLEPNIDIVHTLNYNATNAPACAAAAVSELCRCSYLR